MLEKAVDSWERKSCNWQSCALLLHFFVKGGDGEDLFLTASVERVSQRNVPTTSEKLFTSISLRVYAYNQQGVVLSFSMRTSVNSSRTFFLYNRAQNDERADYSTL